MLKATFRCFGGLSAAAEQRLWDRGILGWRDLSMSPPGLFSPSKTDLLHAQTREAETALAGGCPEYFLSRLDGVHTIRALHDFREETAYVDIETTGLERSAEITMIALYFRGCVSLYVAGINLEEFLLKVTAPSLLVTYNGSRFDLPRLRKRFGIALAQPHIDLCPVMIKMGYRGGLKGCERRMMINRPGCAIADGGDAVTLWRRYQSTGDSDILETLMRYSAYDVVNLERICKKLYMESMSGYPLHTPFHLPRPIPAGIGKNRSLTIE